MLITLFLILLVTIFIAIYFVPSFIAIKRKHAHTLQITILNAFLGWSFIAWVAALIWSTTNFIDENISIKSAKIIILVCYLLTVIPIMLFGIIPHNELKRTIQESSYHKDYKLKTGQTIREYVQTKQIEVKN